MVIKKKGVYLLQVKQLKTNIMKYYTIQESYKNGLLIRKSSMKDYEVILNLEHSIQKQMQMYLEHDFKVVRNGNDIIFASRNPKYDIHIVRFKKYEE